jgi:hypothetical protein
MASATTLSDVYKYLPLKPQDKQALASTSAAMRKDILTVEGMDMEAKRGRVKAYVAFTKKLTGFLEYFTRYIEDHKESLRLLSITLRLLRNPQKLFKLNLQYSHDAYNGIALLLNYTHSNTEAMVPNPHEIIVQSNATAKVPFKRANYILRTWLEDTIGAESMLDSATYDLVVNIDFTDRTPGLKHTGLASNLQRRLTEETNADVKALLVKLMDFRGFLANPTAASQGGTRRKTVKT